MDKTEDYHVIQNNPILQRLELYFLSFLESGKVKKNTEARRQLLGKCLTLDVCNNSPNWTILIIIFILWTLFNTFNTSSLLIAKEPL